MTLLPINIPKKRYFASNKHMLTTLIFKNIRKKPHNVNHTTWWQKLNKKKKNKKRKKGGILGRHLGLGH